MTPEEKLQKIQDVLEGRTPALIMVDETNLMEHAGELPPETKVALLKAMGFTRYGSAHAGHCTSLQGSGLICTCVQPESTWSHPKDVREFLHETPKEREEATRKRIRAEDDPYDADRWESKHA